MNNGGRDATLVGMIAQAKANALSNGSTTSNVPEGANLYFTSARARAVISATSPLAYSSSTGAISANGLMLYQTKWLKQEEINSFEDILTCKNYENEPYDTEVDKLDENMLPTGEKIISTAYKNNITEW